VILAAGRGSRLGAASADIPKWLLDVAGRPIADRQLEAVALANDRLPGTVDTVRVVTGHEAEAIEGFLAGRPDALVTTLNNEEYARLNNWYSVLLALRAVPADRASRLVILNADLFAKPEWFASFIADCATTDAESLIAVDLERALTDESMKVSVATSTDGGAPQLERIGKVDIDNPAGEYVGMLMARGGVLRQFRECLETFTGDPAEADAWYEKAVALTAGGGAAWHVWPTPDSGWIEIDDDRDHAAAQSLARES